MIIRRAAAFASALAALLCAAPAPGGDLTRRRAAPAPVYEAPPPAFLWNGFYAGVQGGWGFANFQGGGRQLVDDANGGLIGVAGGYNYQLAENVLIGAEADFSFAWVSAGAAPWFGVATQGSVDDLLTLRGRFGYVMDRTLFFVTGGFAASRNAVAVSAWNFSGYQASFEPGWTLGGGVEYLITPKISAKGEYLYASTGSENYFPSTPFSTSSGVGMSTVRAGVNFHF